VEDDLALRFTLGAEGDPLEDSPVLENQKSASLGLHQKAILVHRERLEKRSAKGPRLFG
jgi:hypothetical protein